jgi:hypothetical protein
METSEDIIKKVLEKWDVNLRNGLDCLQDRVKWKGFCEHCK